MFISSEDTIPAADHIGYESRAFEVPLMAVPELESTELGATPVGAMTDLPERYEIKLTMGRGGMQTIFEAFDRDRGTNVILMVLHSSPADSEKVLAMARSLIALRHPSLVLILDAFRCNDTIVVVAEAVESAAPLSEIVKAGPPGPEEAARWVAETAEAIQHGLDHGLDWCTIDSGDVCIRHDGRAVITDLTRLTSPSRAPDGIHGNLGFLAPQWLETEKPAEHGRSAVYSLGVVLYNMMTGSLPFQGDGPELIRRILHNAPRRPRSIRRSIPEELDAVCLKAMARKPEERYANPRELAGALREFLARQPARKKPFWKRS
jgi:serine/threonine-protein kinase